MGWLRFCYKELMRCAALLIAIGLAVCCADQSTTPAVPIDVRIVLAVGETADIPGDESRIRFEGVIGDSRCPSDAVCIQGGDAIVRIVVLGPRGAVSTYDLHTGDLRPARHRDLTIALEELRPYPFSSRPIAPEDYRATLHVTR